MCIVFHSQNDRRAVALAGPNIVYLGFYNLEAVVHGLHPASDAIQMREKTRGRAFWSTGGVEVHHTNIFICYIPKFANNSVPNVSPPTDAEDRDAQGCQEADCWTPTGARALGFPARIHLAG